MKHIRESLTKLRNEYGLQIYGYAAWKPVEKKAKVMVYVSESLLHVSVTAEVVCQYSN